MTKSRLRRRTPLRAPIVNGLPLSAGQAAALRAAEDQSRVQGFDPRARAAARLHDLEAALARERQALEVQEGLSETVALERARGEEVEISNRAEERGRVRVRSRDGLESLARAGALSPAQFRAGMLYRDLYEAADPERDLRSQMNSPAFMAGGRSAGGHVTPEAWAARRARLAQTIAQIETKVRVADRNDRAVQALREVAGHARCVSHISKGGGGQAAFRRSLILALDIVAIHFGIL